MALRLDVFFSFVTRKSHLSDLTSDDRELTIFFV